MVRKVIFHGCHFEGMASEDQLVYIYSISLYYAAKQSKVCIVFVIRVFIKSHHISFGAYMCICVNREVGDQA